MGNEFLQKVEHTIQVARDRDRMALAQRDLFTRCLDLAANYELLRLGPEANLEPGDEIHIECHGDTVVAVSINRVVGTFDNPSQGLLDLLAEYGIAGGRVDEVHGESVADIEIIP